MPGTINEESSCTSSSSLLLLSSLEAAALADEDDDDEVEEETVSTFVKIRGIEGGEVEAIIESLPVDIDGIVDDGISD